MIFSLEKGMFSTLDQIVKYLKSIYEGSFQRTSQMKGFHPPLGLNHHLLKKTVNRENTMMIQTFQRRIVNLKKKI